MPRTVKKAKVVGKSGRKVTTAKSPSEGVRVQPDVAAALGTILAWAAQLLNAISKVTDAPPCDCPNPCANVPNGKKRILICDGTTVTALAGTQDGQYLAWDHTAGTWVLTTV